jgi:predicted flavoprotein YhiN
MSAFESNEKQLLKKLLEPLLEDFQYWFARTRQLLEQERLSFLSPQEQGDLLERVKQAQQEVNTAKMMFQATEGEVGINLSTVMPWHQLLRVCWKVSFQWRSLTENEESK